MTNENVNAMYVATNGKLDGLNVDCSSNNGLSGNLSTNTVIGNNSLLWGYNGTAWDYWQGYYYPQVIRESYPVYVKERAEDNGKKAFEIIKVLQDKKLMKLDKVSDFIEAMDCLIKNL